MKVDKYRDMALRNPIGCTWWNWLESGGGWEQVAQKLHKMGIFKYYCRVEGSLEEYLKLSKELIPIMVWDLGMSSWWLQVGVPAEVAQGDISTADFSELRRDVAQVRLEWGAPNGAELKKGVLSGVPLECIFIDQQLEEARNKIYRSNFLRVPGM